MTDAGTQQPPRRSLRLILILGGLSAFAPLSIDMYLPALPRMATDLHTGAAQTQLTLTTCLIGLAAGQLIAGPISDRFGRRTPLLVGLVAYTLVSLACAFAPSVYALIGLRLVQALGGAAGIVISRAAVRDLYSGIAMAKFFSLLMLVNGVAPIVAPVLGGQILRFTSWRGVFVVLTLIGLALLLATVLGLGETLPPERRRSGGLRDTLRTYRRLAGDRLFTGYTLATGLAFAAMFTYISGSSFVLQDIYGLSPQQFSLVFGTNSLGIMAAGQLNSWLVDRFPPRRLLTIGLYVITVGGLGLLAAVLGGLGLPGILPPLFLAVASIGVIMPNATALALADHPDTAGAASALLGAGQFVIGGLSAPLVGLAGEGTAIGMAAVIAALGTASLVVFLLVARLRETVSTP